MTRKRLTAFDVDTDGMADALRRLADGIDEGDVAIAGASTSTHIDDPEDLAAHGFSVDYHTTHAYADVADMIRFATDAYLRFKDRYIGPILNNSKSATVRYGLRRDMEPGDQIALIDEDDDTFATAYVDAVFDVTIDTFVGLNVPGYTGVDADHLVGTLRELYDDDSIDAETTVTVVLFEDVEPNDDYPTDQYTANL